MKSGGKAKLNEPSSLRVRVPTAGGLTKTACKALPFAFKSLASTPFAAETVKGELIDRSYASLLATGALPVPSPTVSATAAIALVTVPSTILYWNQSRPVKPGDGV